MIDVTESIIALARTVPGIGGRVYRHNPQKRIAEPYIVLSPIGRTVEVVDDDGSEILVRLTYSLDFYAKSPSQVDSIISHLSDKLANRGFHTTGYTASFEPTNKLYRANVTYDGGVDRRGNTFS